MKSVPAVQRRKAVAEASPWLTNPTGQLWHTLTSVRLALVLILLIALAVLAGTLLDQVPASIANDQTAYDRWLDGLRGRYGIFTDVMATVGLFHVFSAIWFRMLIALLVANIIVCTVNRWPSIRSQVFKPRVRMNPAYFERARVGASFNVTLDTAVAATAVKRGLRSAGYRALTDQGESVAMYADRFRLSRLGTFLTHLSLILILVGAILGTLFGWSDDQFIVAEGTTQTVPLAKNISVKLVQFEDEWYPSGQPKDYASQIVIYDNGKEVKSGTTHVNSPVVYKGIAFNQSFYGQVAELQVKDATGKEILNQPVPLAWTSTSGNRPIGWVDVPDTDYKAYIVGPEPGTYDQAVPLGGVRLELYDKNGKLADIKDLPRNQDVESSGLTFRFLREGRFTGLKLVKDPGVNLVWIASGLMVAGLIMVFWFPHRRLWALVSPRPDGGAEVRLAAASQRDLGLEKDFEQVTAKVRRALSRRQHEEKEGGPHV
jgi:cytochrome c biogenesis protein